MGTCKQLRTSSGVTFELCKRKQAHAAVLFTLLGLLLIHLRSLHLPLMNLSIKLLHQTMSA